MLSVWWSCVPQVSRIWPYQNMHSKHGNHVTKVGTARRCKDAM